MKIEEFKREFKHMNYVEFDGIVLFNDFEVYDKETKEETKYKTLDEALKHKYKGKTILQLIEEKEDLKIRLDGGRGASSGGEGTSLFGGQDGSNGVAKADPDLPARMNRMYNGNKSSQENTLNTFRKQHASSKEEHLIAMDDDGFVSAYTHGGKSSVGYSPGQVAGKHVIHNHPNGSNFSKADLDGLTSTKQKSITATSEKVTYRVEKGKNFDAKGFKKALNNAKTTETDYNKAVDKFLRQNAKKYGYKYTMTEHN